MPSYVSHRETRLGRNDRIQAALEARLCGRGEDHVEILCFPSSRIKRSGSCLLVVSTPGTLTEANSLASSGAVIQHDRLDFGSCLDIDFLSMGCGRALQIR